MALLGILILGSAFRFYNVNWDEGTYHIHPDERHTTMVITRIQWPASLAEYFDTSRSPLNARNMDTVYFYGTLPLFLTKAVASQLDALGPHLPFLQTDQSYGSYDRVHLVGRVLSALFDLGSVLLTFFLGRRLFGWRVGLVAAFLLSVTVLNIQGSHYFAVDTFLSFFVLLTIWFTLDVAEGRGPWHLRAGQVWPAFLGLGLSMGLTLACKVSVFLLVVVVALGAWVRIRRQVTAGGEGTWALLGTTLGLGLSVFVALAVFRVAQPYAWAGPNYDAWESIPENLVGPFELFRAMPEPVRAVLMPNPQWLDDIGSAGAQQTGEADLPWGRQWTERTPWLWPLENMILWTLGVPLGVAAWTGVLLASVAVIWRWRRQRREEGAAEARTFQDDEPLPRREGLPDWELVLIPLAWVLLTFGWQGMQYVKSVRYFLPIHPYLAVFAAWLVVSTWDWARRGSQRHGLRLATGGLAAVVLVGTLAWAFAFIQIYTEPVTRVQATRWIYDNVPSGATLHYETPGGEQGQLQLPLSSTQIYATNRGWIVTPFIPPHDLTAIRIVMNELTGAGPAEGAFEVQISADLPGQPMARAEVRGILGAEVLLDLPDVELQAGKTYQFESRAVEGAPLIAEGATLHGRTAEGEDVWLTLALAPDLLYPTDQGWHVVSFTPPQTITALDVVMTNLQGAQTTKDGAFEVRIRFPESLGGSDDEPVTLTAAEIRGTFGPGAEERHILDIPDVALEGGRTYYFESRALEGAPLVAYGSVLANEHFDDPLPFNMFDYLAFGRGLYRSLGVVYPGSSHHIDQLPLYDEDTPEKLEVLLDALDQADYIIMSSGRLWQSIPRLPMRYPMTTRYYELLFAGELGFEQAAEFHSYPRLFGIEFDDTWAEEQFTVYDHPRVLIYHKTADYDRERTRALLSEGIRWDEIPHWLNPRDVPEWRREQARLQRTGAARNDLMLTAEVRQIQEQGGTWASIFDRNSPANRWPTFTWLLLLAAVGLAALPLTVAVFGRLSDGGYILARPVGVLLLAWLSWMLTNLTPLHYTRGTIWLALAIVAAVSYGSLLLPGPRRRLAALFSRGGQWRVVLVSELLFLAFFGLFWLIRWGNPDLWHPWKGGEKPMDLAYLNAVIKSTEFPPYDPWFAGGYLNYYYFGQVMVGSLIKLAGIAPAVAYNLVIPAWFAMTAMGAFSVTYNLYRARTQGREAGRLPGGSRALLIGLLGAVFVALLGNLAQIHLLLQKVADGVLENFASTIPGLAGLVRAVVGSFEVLFGGRALPIGIDEWYWNASRAIPAGPYEAVITEFPFFTFLYADLHAHLIAMPLTFLSLALALAVVQRAAAEVPGEGRGQFRAWRGLLTNLVLLFLWALIIGAMRTTNSWDVPPHLIVAFGALAIATAQGSRDVSRRHMGGALLLLAGQFLVLFGLSWWLLYWPFWEKYGSFYNSLGLWSGTRTPLWAYLVVHGLFLFCIASYLVARTLGEWRRVPVLHRMGLTLRYAGRGRRDQARWDLRRAARLTDAQGLPAGPLTWLVAALLVLLCVFFLVPGLVSFTRADPLLAESGNHAYRGLAALGLGLPLGILGLLLLFRPIAPHKGQRADEEQPQRYVAPAERLWAWLVLLALGMSLGVEVLVLEGDIGRMNTVFKFYLQVWLMWGVTAAAAVGWMVPRVRRWGSPVRAAAAQEPAPNPGAALAAGEPGAQGEASPETDQPDGTGSLARRWWVAILVALIAFAALYPPLATSAKLRDRWHVDQPPGLDGWKYMETANYWDPVGAEWGHDGGVRYDLKWDREAMSWLLDNVVGSPTILEGHTPEYRWGARYAVNTGLPTVLGWNWHQRQQRAAADQQAVWNRAQDVATIYNVGGTMVAEELLQRYGVRYIIVGPLERAYYDEFGLLKFEGMAREGRLQVVFRNQGVTIYMVPERSGVGMVPERSGVDEVLPGR